MYSVFKNIVQTNLLIIVTGVLITLPALAAKKARPADDRKTGRIPVKIIQTGATNNVFTGQSFTYSTPAGLVTIPHAYGHLTQYNLQVRDNKGNPYGYGRAKEGFMNINPTGSNPNPAEPNGHMWEKGANIVDTNGQVFNSDPHYADNKLLISFDQLWACYVGSKRYPLNTHYVANYYKYSTRVVGNN